MEYGEISAYPLYGGRVTEWTATVPAGAGRADSRALSPQHADHILEYRADADPDWIGTVFEIPETYDAEAMRTALWGWHARHEAFRTTGLLVDGELVRRTYDADEISFVATDGGFAANGSEAEAALLTFFERAISGVRWPHLVTATVVPDEQDPDDPRFMVVFGGDHAVMDAYAQVLGVTEIHELYLAALRGDTPELSLPSSASYADFSHAEAAMAAELNLDNDTTRRWHRFLEADGRFPQFPLALRPHGVEPAEDPTFQSGLSQWVLDAQQAAAFNVRTRELGYSMQSGVMAAMAMTLQRISHADQMNVVMPMHTRTAGFEDSMGWFVGIAPVSINLLGHTSYLSNLERTTHATRHVKTDAKIPFTRTASVVCPKGGPRFAACYIELRHARGAEDFARLRTRLLRSRYAADDEVYLWVLRSHTGMTLASRFPDNEVARHNVHHFANVLRGVLQDLASGQLDPQTGEQRVSKQPQRELAPHSVRSAAEPDTGLRLRVSR